MKKQLGFTILELLVVIAIIGILATIAITSTSEARLKAKISAAEQQLAQLYRAALLLEQDTGEWPGGHEPRARCSGAGIEVEDLNDPVAGLVANHAVFDNWSGPYMSNVPEDPWGQPYIFDYDYDLLDEIYGAGERAAAFVSFGPNKVGVNAYDEDDIIVIMHQLGGC